MRFFKRNSATHYSLFRALTETMLFVVSVMCIVVPHVLVYTYAHLLSPPAFILLAIATFLLVPIADIVVWKPTMLRAQRAIMSDEEFFARHPREYRKEVARWRKVSAFLNGMSASGFDDLPGILLLKRDLSDADAARLGFSKGSEESDEDIELACLKYDRIYYTKHKLMLRLEIRLLNLKRAMFLILKNTNMPVTPYERRLNDFAEEFFA